MKKNIVNDKVIRAMAIGISAMLATATPMTALAAEEGEGAAPEPDTSKTSDSGSTVETAKEAVGEASDSIDAAQDSASTIKEDVAENVVAGEVKDNEGNDLAQDVIDAAANVENSDEEGKNTPLEGAEDRIGEVNAALGDAKTFDEASGGAYGDAKNAATDAEDIASDVKDAMVEANKKADEQVQQIKDATTVADANAAYKDLEETADQAQKNFDAKLTEYNTAKAAYEEAAAKVKEYEDAYNAARESADKNAAKAQEELETAKANAQALKDAVDAAKDAVDASAAGALEIADKEKLTREDSGLVWANEDELFKVIMKNYYLPEVLKIYDENATVIRRRGKDNNNYNYFEVVYTDSEGSKTVYYNYKMDKDENGKESKDKIVIFEKRIEEVNWEKYQNENPDQYVKDNGTTVTVDNVAAGVKNGTIVDANGKYVEKNDMTDSETLVTNSEITKTSTTDVTVDKDKQESWSYDAETGELVKTVTADVTTITYTKTNFDPKMSYATDAERDAAAAAKKDELEKATGKDATINETEDTTSTYTATGTYIPTFTKTVNVKNEEVESGRIDWLREADSDAEAVAIVKKEQEKKLREDDDIYCISIKSDLAVSGHTKDKWYDDSDYLVSGTVTATYAKVTKQTVSQSTFGALWDDIKSLFGGQSTNEKLEEAARKAVEAEGGIFIGANWDDWKYNKATIRYVAGVKVTTDEKQTEQTAKDAVQGTALEQAKANGATGVYYVQTKGTDEVAHTKYSYTVDYLTKVSENTENMDIATETYGNAIGLSGQIIQNKKYLDQNILLTQNDPDYRAFVDKATKYDRLLTEAENAHNAVIDAQDKVKALQNEIKNLEKRESNLGKLDDLKKALYDAEIDRDAAEDTLNEILKKLEDAGVTRDEVVDRLTPNTPGGGTGGNGGNGGNPGGGTPGTTDEGPGADTTADGPATVVTTTATANTAVAAQAVAANGAGAGNAAAGNAAGNAAAGNQGVVTIEDEATPLAASIDDQDATDTKKIKEDAQTVTIEDEASPLDASIDQEKMSWWWLLIVMILGATGYEMYRKHQEKKKAAEEIKVEE